MKIPIGELKTELKNNVEQCKNINSYDNIIISKSIFGLFSKLINKFEKTKSYQTGLFIKSMNDWIDRKNDNKPLSDKIEEVKSGEIYMIDWNLGYDPELSYEHPGIVVENIDNFLFVLPVSGQKHYIDIAYHPLNKPDGDKNYRLVDEKDGFNKLCVIHLDQARSISITRLLYKMGEIPIEQDGKSSLFCELKEYMLNKYFPNEYNNFLEVINEDKKRIEYLSIQRKCNQSRADRYRNENERLKKEIKRLENIIDKSN